MRALEYVGRAGWAVRGVEARLTGVDWPRWNPAVVDDALASMGWVRMRDWVSGGGLHFAEVIPATGL